MAWGADVNCFVAYLYQFFVVCNESFFADIIRGDLDLFLVGVHDCKVEGIGCSTPAPHLPPGVLSH